MLTTNQHTALRPKNSSNSVEHNTPAALHTQMCQIIDVAAGVYQHASDTLALPSSSPSTHNKSILQRAKCCYSQTATAAPSLAPGHIRLGPYNEMDMLGGRRIMWASVCSNHRR